MVSTGSGKTSRSFFRLFLGTVLGSLLLTSCATPGLQTAAPANWQAQLKQMQALKQWTARGKIALRSETASESATLLWQQRGETALLQLSGPLGVGATTVTSDGQILQIEQDGEQRNLDISTPDAIVLNTGWDLPLRALPYWLKGVPSPDHSIQNQEFTPQQGQLSSFQQDDWHIQYDNYKLFDKHLLPTRLIVERGTTRVKVIIRDWRDLSGG